jgi:DeoR family transcriptional regulator, fructose operon transcriptional repressor
LLAEERRHRIREILSRRWTVAASELCAELGVTSVTIRRDLGALERQGVLVRSHGGAVSRMSSTSLQPAYETLLQSRREEKQAIARAAEDLILEGDTVFLEGSTTVFELAQRLAGRNRLTVVTNYPPILTVFQHTAGITVICTGGDLQQDTYYLSGEWALRLLSEIRVDKAVLGVSAIDLSYGVSTSRPPEAQIKRMAIKAARVTIGLADHTKFGKQAFAFVGPVSDLDVIATDSKTDPRCLADLRDAKIDVRVA